MAKYPLKGKTVVLSGASGGIGACIAELLVNKYGARVIGIGRNEQKLAAVKQKLGDNFSYEAFDVSARENWHTFGEKLEKTGVIPDLIINNAGVFPRFSKTVSIDSEQFKKVMDVNFYAGIYSTEELMPLLKKSSAPGVYFVCSSAALCPVAGTAPYTAAKNALKGYAECMSLENNGKLYVGIAYPGVTMSDLFRGDDRVKKSGADKIAASPMKTAKKICRAIYRKKRKKVTGFDTHGMNFLARIFPKTGDKFVARVMKISKAEVFSDLF